MIQIYSESPRKIMQNKNTIEKTLNVKLKRQENIIYIEAEPEDEFLATEVIEAINLGFPIQHALMLKEDGIVFKRIRIKDITRRKDLYRVRGRIIGTMGGVLKTLETLTNCFISIHDNLSGIIGKQEDIGKAEHALKSIISGSKHSSVYAYLEKQNSEEKGLI